MRAARTIVLAAVLCCTPALAAPTPPTGEQHFSMHDQAPDRIEEFARAKILMTADASGGRFTLLDEIWKPGFYAPPHFHKRHAEMFYVVSGEVEWTIAGETKMMRAGDLVLIPPNTVHSVHQKGPGDLHMIMIQNPGGYEDRYAVERRYTSEQLKTPEVQAEIAEAGDFNLAP